jgi:hypothetical protein
LVLSVVPACWVMAPDTPEMCTLFAAVVLPKVTAVPPLTVRLLPALTVPAPRLTAPAAEPCNEMVWPARVLPELRVTPLPTSDTVPVVPPDTFCATVSSPTDSTPTRPLATSTALGLMPALMSTVPIVSAPAALNENVWLGATWPATVLTAWASPPSNTEPPWLCRLSLSVVMVLPVLAVMLPLLIRLTCVAFGMLMLSVISMPPVMSSSQR